MYLKGSKLVSAADVFVYFGSLRTVFGLVAERLITGDVFAFTVEALTDNAAAATYDTASAAADQRPAIEYSLQRSVWCIRF